MAAMELEFTLIDPRCRSARRRRWRHRCWTDPRRRATRPLRMPRFLTRSSPRAAAMEITLQGAVSESGPGQFELNLSHRGALRMADDAWLIKQAIRGCGAQARAGRDLHGQTLRRAVRQCDARPCLSRRPARPQPFRQRLAQRQRADASRRGGLVWPACRPRPWSLHPGTTVSSGSPPAPMPPPASPGGMRTAPPRCASPAAIPRPRRRIEHRVPGADANPYLVLAAVLGAMMIGVEDELTPPEPVIGNAYLQRVLQLPTDWDNAITRFADSPKMARILPARADRPISPRPSDRNSGAWPI